MMITRSGKHCEKTFNVKNIEPQRQMLGNINYSVLVWSAGLDNPWVQLT